MASSQHCRICGVFTGELEQQVFHIFENSRKIFEKITSCLPVVITEDDPYSKFICELCTDQLDNFHSFQEKSKDTDKNIRNNAVKVKEEPVEEDTGHQEFICCEPLQPITGEGTLNQSAMVTEASEANNTELRVEYKCGYCGAKYNDYNISEAHIRENHSVERAARFAGKGNTPLSTTKTAEPAADAKPAVQTKTTTMFRCTYCKLMFVTREATAKHVLESHKAEREKRFALSEIKQNETPTSVAIPVDPSLPNKALVFRCKYCNQYFSNLEIIRDHIVKTHQNLDCSFCNEKFSSLTEMHNHLKTHDPKLKCLYCASTFQTNEDLKSHEQTCWIPKLKNYKKKCECGYCGSQYYDKPTLEKHIIRCHLCIVCGKVYPRGGSNSLKYHKISHEQDLESRRNKVCDVCGAKFIANKSLVIHMRQHTGERPYLCHLCPNKYTSREGLRKHLFLHTGVKSFKCEECGKTFARSEYLKVHVLTHTGEKPHMCEVCGKCFTQQSSLNSHRKLHLKSMTCHLCGHISRTKSALVKHVKSHLTPAL